MITFNWKHARWVLPSALVLMIACVGMSQEEDEDDGDEAIKSINDVPALVREAAIKVCGKEIKSISKEQEHGEMMYEFEYMSAGAEASAVFSESGALCTLEHTVAASTLPKSMLEQIQKRYPGATIARAETTEVHGYEVQILVGGKKQDVEASATGRLAKSGGDEDDEDEEAEENEEHEGHGK